MRYFCSFFLTVPEIIKPSLTVLREVTLYVADCTLISSEIFKNSYCQTTCPQSDEWKSPNMIYFLVISLFILTSRFSIFFWRCWNHVAPNVWVDVIQVVFCVNNEYCYCQICNIICENNVLKVDSLNTVKTGCAVLYHWLDICIMVHILLIHMYSSVKMRNCPLVLFIWLFYDFSVCTPPIKWRSHNVSWQCELYILINWKNL